MLTAIAVLLAPAPLRDYKPTSAELAAAYVRADTIGSTWASLSKNLRLEPRWIDDGKAFWFRREGVGDTAEFVRVDSATGAKSPLFDAKRLATTFGEASGKTVDAGKLPFRTLDWQGRSFRFDADGFQWTVDLSTYAVSKAPATPRPVRRPDPWIQNTWPPVRNPMVSPDSASIARIEGHDVLVGRVGGPEVALTTDGSPSAYYARLTWTPDSTKVVAVRVRPGDRNKVFLIQSSPPQGGPAKLLDRIYDRPGDRVDTFDLVILDPTRKSPPKVVDTVEYGDIPYFRKRKDGALSYEKVDRGYGRFRIMRLDPASATVSPTFDEDPATFVDTTGLITEYLSQSDEAIVTSERDGWHHLYLADGKGALTQITRGPWVVRSVVKVDEKIRQITFTASGMTAGEDPYFIHYYRIGFDGTGLVSLTPTIGNHSVDFAPNGETFVDTYSTVESAPVHELRRASDGSLIKEIERADISSLLKGGWRVPKAFVAKGRDGATDIYGVVFRPTHFDPKKRYPVIEDIYAGPHDSFVPKSFSPNFYQQRLAELGFIVVKIDGMGTRNRSKAFHDVCFQNLADAGFPDRILWMKALAKADSSVDIRRVGIFGTSAGGQNAGGAVLFHPEFYKVAVASCGCHDNRLDKIWWNEQWMGLMGPHYAASSNIDNAAKLQGKLLLLVGELDTNVPPESTYRFADALQRANKEFELVMLPNLDHTAGGAYGERKRRDFFVRHLLGVEPPNPNLKNKN